MLESPSASTKFIQEFNLEFGQLCVTNSTKFGRAEFESKEILSHHYQVIMSEVEVEFSKMKAGFCNLTDPFKKESMRKAFAVKLQWNILGDIDGEHVDVTITKLTQLNEFMKKFNIKPDPSLSRIHKQFYPEITNNFEIILTLLDESVDQASGFIYFYPEREKVIKPNPHQMFSQPEKPLEKDDECDDENQNLSGFFGCIVM